MPMVLIKSGCLKTFLRYLMVNIIILPGWVGGFDSYLYVSLIEKLDIKCSLV